MSPRYFASSILFTLGKRRGREEKGKGERFTPI